VHFYCQHLRGNRDIFVANHRKSQMPKSAKNFLRLAHNYGQIKGQRTQYSPGSLVCILRLMALNKSACTVLRLSLRRFYLKLGLTDAVFPNGLHWISKFKLRENCPHMLVMIAVRVWLKHWFEVCFWCAAGVLQSGCLVGPFIHCA